MGALFAQLTNARTPRGFAIAGAMLAGIILAGIVAARLVRTR